MARIRVALVFGGASEEHPVSCLTAHGVAAALDPERYDVVGVGITRDGRWVVVPREEIIALDVQDGQLPELTTNGLTGSGSQAILLPGTTGSQLVRRAEGGAALAEVGPVDVAFALLHGPFGEDGTIQGLFEMMGTRYVGSGVLASAVGMDKHYMKTVFAAAGLPVGPYAVITPADWRRDPAQALKSVSSLNYPLYVKPARGGSSIGITKIIDESQLEAAIDYAHRFDPKIVVEEGLEHARELECGVLESLDGGLPQVSAVAEIRMHNDSGFYDFQAKYLPEEQVDLDVPAQHLDADVVAELQALASRAFESIGGEGLARVDFFLTAEGRPVINEINTMPGFTEHSMFPQVWAASGIDYPSLVDRLLQLAVKRPTGLR
ncbi:D-alanine--D-alanine ligase [Microlunatus endophyticus]|uniref:D-alanine--D-alanine ligase n=1 Tax=Microlunatus endophyticus TaxID=1716077 RepID=A0A917W019_9ACTN|nr:D-alanine--D-alanine ligase family protein [Microlunatus endophyticus]GGL50257.1 D-alanine--D-alanine ligase [Microlunatus endophyticus]